MTDGPFKNLRLGSCWKRHYEAVWNDAVSPAECGELASDALVRHLVTKGHSEALHLLDAHSGKGQFEFDPLGSVEDIFDQCEKTPFLDAFQKELLSQVGNYTSVAEAVAPALDAAVKSQISEARNRFQEECIRAHEIGEKRWNAYEQAQEKINSSFDAIEITKVCDALLAGKKDAFKKSSCGSVSVDEGFVQL